MEVEAITFDNYKTITYGADSITDIMPPVLELLEEKMGKISGFMKVYRKLDERYFQMRNTKHVEISIKSITHQTLYELGYISSDFKTLVDETFEDYQEERGFKWYPETHSTLDKLREKGYKLGLISNISWPVPRSMIKSMSEMFDVVTYSLTHGMRKPHSVIFHDTINELGVQPNKSVHVGDDYGADIIGAKNAGMYAIHVQREEKLDAPLADKIITNLSELDFTK